MATRSVAIWIFSSITPVAAGASACDAGPWTGIETALVTDARTIVLGDGRAVRLAGLESLAALAHDRQTANAMDARLADHLAQWLAAKPLHIRVLPGKPDRHGRHAALVMAGDELLQEHLLSAGLAVFMPERFSDDTGDACAKRLLALEAAARLARRGGWSDPGFSSPTLGRTRFRHNLAISSSFRVSSGRLERGATGHTLISAGSGATT